jgi:hypothetical protein
MVVVGLVGVLTRKYIEKEKAKSLFGLTWRNCSNLSTPGIVARASAAAKKSASAEDPLG